MKAICRIAKLKSGGSISGSEFHTKRSRETPNADLTKQNERFIGNDPRTSSLTLEQEVYLRIGNNGGKKIRTDAVLCVEILLTASPEYFRPDDHGKAGKWDAHQLEDWKQANRAWLAEKFGDRIVRAELHLDESTPHIHAYFVPLDESGKLNCKKMFGDRKKLSDFQDSYAQAMAPLGLERGIKGSRATHTQVKEYYAAVVKELDDSLTPDEITHQLADRTRVLKENADLQRTAESLAQERERFQQQIREMQAQIDRQHQELMRQVEATAAWKKKYQARVEQLREIPLTQVAEELGFNPDPKDKRKWRNDDLSLNLTENKFYDWHEMRGGGGAIDLVMHVERCGFGDAVAWLRDRFGDAEAVQTITRQVEQTLVEQPRQPFVPPTPDEQNWEPVRSYLTQTRKLPAVIVDRLYESGLIYADENQNAVFLRRLLPVESSIEPEVTGAALRGTAGVNNTFKGLAAGSKRSQGWFYMESNHTGDVQQMVVCESSIDVLSYATLHPPQQKTLYLSTDGASSLPLERLQQSPQVILAFDHDLAGASLSERLQQELPQASEQFPIAKDWNEELHRHLAQLRHQFEALNRSQKRDQEYGL